MKHHQHQKNQQDQSKIRHFSLFLSFVFSLSLLYPFSQIFAALSCSVTTQAACTGGSVTLLRMSGSTNAHAELPSQSNSNYANNVICCSGVPTIGNSCAASNKQIIARISGVTNGTIQETSINTYGTNVCLSDSVDNDVITFGYQNSNCTGYDTTLASISSSDNAHIGDGSAYTRKICAKIVQPSITFDIDTGTSSSTENGPGYSVPLGTLSSASVTVSNGSVNMIIIEGETNAAGGMVVTVMSSGGSDGLKSLSVPTDKIPSSTTSPITAGTARYGLCVASAGLSDFTRSGTYSTTCALNSGSNNIVGLTTTPVEMLNSGGAALPSTAHAEVVVNATISPTTPAHNDYEDNITFIASGTF